MSHFSFGKMSQCRPTFFIVKHKTAHKYLAKKSFIPVQAALEETPRVAHEALTGLNTHATRHKPPPWPGAVGPGPVGSVHIPSTSQLKRTPQWDSGKENKVEGTERKNVGGPGTTHALEQPGGSSHCPG